jgi:hypothetical protein
MRLDICSCYETNHPNIKWCKANRHLICSWFGWVVLLLVLPVVTHVTAAVWWLCWAGQSEVASLTVWRGIVGWTFPWSRPAAASYGVVLGQREDGRGSAKASWGLPGEAINVTSVPFWWPAQATRPGQIWGGGRTRHHLLMRGAEVFVTIFNWAESAWLKWQKSKLWKIALYFKTTCRSVLLTPYDCQWMFQDHLTPKIVMLQHLSL